MDALEPVVVVGLGELGGELSRGLLAIGHPVFPVLRDTPQRAVAERVDPAFVLISVGEADLDAALAATPEKWRDRLVLVQNELVPASWQRHGLPDPGVVVVWFEKKPGRAAHVVLPSVVWGRGAPVIARALDKLDLPVRAAPDRDALVLELVLKNLYILTTNIAGLRTGGTAFELWHEHHEVALGVAGEVLQLQEKLTQRRLPAEDLLTRMLDAIEADPEHRCTGRSAPARLARALRQAAEFDLDVPTLRAIAAEQRVAL